jgi:UDP-glucuronate decarboxylase
MAVGDLDSLDGPMNLGTDREVTVKDLTVLIMRLTGSGSSIEHAPLPQDDPMQRRPDLSKARSTIGWSPSWTLEEGLKETIENFRRLPRASSIAP